MAYTFKHDIVERTVEDSIAVIQVYHKIKRSDDGRIIGRQLLKSATSIGANMHEAQGAQSKADFITKISIAHKEAYETSYWFKILQKSQLIKEEYLDEVIDETTQVLKILSSILISSKGQK
ncbi:MAG: four helix bundle protein [Candidatus Marinimicrobia bacterium]|jgi:four helix bundle protein|nr:four helix bundle protein [Candidatus Neomarinimicrobiota bacterium]